VSEALKPNPFEPLPFSVAEASTWGAGVMVAELRRHGFSLRLNGGRLVVRPADRITDDLHDLIARRKDVVKDVLRQEYERGSSSELSTPPSTRTCIRINVPFNDEWKEGLMEIIPSTHREWRPKPEKRWVVWEPYCDAAIEFTAEYFPYQVKYGDAITEGRIPHKAAANMNHLEAFNVTTMPAPIPADTRASVWEKTAGLCWYCGARLIPHRTFHVDHVRPRSDGGGDDIANLVPACATCNTDKGALRLETFRLKRGGGLFWFEIVRTL